eukprot:TRINITY_DN19352_c0_g1_i1.p1 TRINITY_DN19352_c0_g1~~TRINITY_DN19352_c0_g1_i1.p1  ORF type:complete len:193 (-),score=29.88 TRINITY_DN19352_c0_g1_i1:14-547(-)
MEEMEFKFDEIDPKEEKIMEEIGRFRMKVWKQEGKVAEELFKDGIWLDHLDPIAKHWILRDGEGAIVASCRMTIHQTLKENPDGYLWIEKGRPLPEPVANISKLVVDAKMRGRGIASRMNQLRIKLAKELGCRSINVTASDANSRLLISKHGFVDTSIRVIFPNRPTIEFQGLEFIY